MVPALTITNPFHQLVSHLTKVLNSLTSHSHFSQDSLKAHITDISKEGKDPSSHAIYCPISLLNIGLKLLIKILATCLLSHVSGLIDLDQVHFLPGQEDCDNVIKVPNLIHVASFVFSIFYFFS